MLRTGAVYVTRRRVFQHATCAAQAGFLRRGDSHTHVTRARDYASDVRQLTRPFIMYVLYRALLLFVHLFYGFVRATRLLWLDLRRPRRPRRDVKRTQLFESICDVRQFKKLPKHFALILGSEEPSPADLVLVIFWCIVFGIPYVTLYDKKGEKIVIGIIKYRFLSFECFVYLLFYLFCCYRKLIESFN